MRGCAIIDGVYRNSLKNREYAQEAPQNFDSERATIAEWQGASENRNYEVKPTQAETDSSGYFGIIEKEEDLMASHITSKESFPSSHEKPQCWACKNPVAEKVHRCATCYFATYCNPDCEKAQQQTHQTECSLFKERFLNTVKDTFAEMETEVSALQEKLGEIQNEEQKDVLDLLGKTLKNLADSIAVAKNLADKSSDSQKTKNRIDLFRSTLESAKRTVQSLEPRDLDVPDIVLEDTTESLSAQNQELETALSQFQRTRRASLFLLVPKST